MIRYSENRNIAIDQILPIYKEHNWSSAQKPELLHKALTCSHSLVSAWDNRELVGIGNAISDGFLVVYYPHLLVSQKYQSRGIGKEIIKILTKKYQDMHMQILNADAKVIGFYEKCGFVRAGKTEPMWIYDGKDH